MKKPQKSCLLMPEKFWGRVDRLDASVCWEWAHSKTAAGYGRVFIYPKMQYAHRIAWVLINGRIPDGMEVCHSCDNPSCVNPSHLFLGSHKENMADMAKKCRSSNDPHKGMRHKLAKLNGTDIERIRKEYKPGIPGVMSKTSIKGLAKEFGVAHSLIHRIIKKRSWSHITESANPVLTAP